MYSPPRLRWKKGDSPLESGDSPQKYVNVVGVIRRFEKRMEKGNH